MTRLIRPLTALAALVLTVFVQTPTAQALSEQEELVERARLTFASMRQEQRYSAINRLLPNAKAIIIFPDVFRGGFVVGGEGGTGVLLARLEDGGWSHPAFFGMGTGSVGLQIGGQVSETVLVVMTEDGLNALFDSQVTLGADASVAVASIGSGIEARTGLDINADMYAFSRNQGLFFGGALEGSYLFERDAWNSAYYTAGATGEAIRHGLYTNSHSDTLRAELTR